MTLAMLLLWPDAWPRGLLALAVCAVVAVGCGIVLAAVDLAGEQRRG